jgi:hypothetical protein
MYHIYKASTAKGGPGPLPLETLAKQAGTDRNFMVMAGGMVLLLLVAQ